MPDNEIIRIEGSGHVSEACVAIVSSRYNARIVDRLLDGCINTLVNGGVVKSAITLVRVPGAFEIPITVKRLAGHGKFDAVITIGAIIRGETPHFDFIAAECSHGLASIALNSGIPIIFGVLTVDDYQQAMDRSGENESNKGSEAADTALEMISLFRNID